MRGTRAKDPEIGDLEAEVLNSLKRLGGGSAGEIVEDLRPRRSLAYTTVSTTLDRLYKKGLATRKQESGRTSQRYVYSFAGDAGLQEKVVNKMVDKLVSVFGPSVASTIYDRLSEVSPEEAAKLGRDIEAKKAAKRTDER